MVAFLVNMFKYGVYSMRPVGGRGHQLNSAIIVAGGMATSAVTCIEVGKRHDAGHRPWIKLGYNVHVYYRSQREAEVGAPFHYLVHKHHLKIVARIRARIINITNRFTAAQTHAFWVRDLDRKARSDG
jgi:hypothetical protein